MSDQRKAFLNRLVMLLGLVACSAQAGVVGEVIAAYDRFSGTFAVMTADGSQFRALPCGGDLTRAGSPRYFVGSVAGSAVLPDGYLTSEIVFADEDCAQTTVVVSRSDMRFSTMPNWSPDGSRIAVYGARFEASNPTPVETGIYLLDVVRSVDGRPIGAANLRLLIAIPDESLIGWSGEGGRLAYSRQLPDGQGKTQSDIFVHDLASGVDMNVTNTPNESEGRPAFSPVDNRIAFDKQVAVRGSYRIEIFTIDAAGGPSIQVTSKRTTGAPTNICPEFSPDGQRLTFASGSYLGPITPFDIWTIQSDGGGKAVNLTGRRDGDFRCPAWRR